MIALALAALIVAQAPDAGTDTPYWTTEPAGTVLQIDSVVATPENAQKFDVALRSAQDEASKGTQKSVYVGLICGSIALVVGLLLGGGIVAIVKK